jgi:hypothetical protein
LRRTHGIDCAAGIGESHYQTSCRVIAARGG